MIEGKCKIVDIFNGGHYGDFDSYDDAECVLDKQYDEFHKNLCTKNCTFKLAIVPIDFEWYFNQRRNEFIWG